MCVCIAAHTHAYERAAFHSSIWSCIHTHAQTHAYIFNFCSNRVQAQNGSAPHCRHPCFRATGMPIHIMSAILLHPFYVACSGRIVCCTVSRLLFAGKFITVKQKLHHGGVLIQPKVQPTASMWLSHQIWAHEFYPQWHIVERVTRVTVVTLVMAVSWWMTECAFVDIWCGVWGFWCGMTTVTEEERVI